MAGAWIDVNLDAVVENYHEVLKYLQPKSRCMAVVKADAYGLGAVEVARALEEAGCRAFAVTRVEEGLILRQQGIKGLILVLGPTMKEEWAQAIEADLQLTFSEMTWIKELDDFCLNMEPKLLEKVQIHIKVETGMGRTGFRLSEAKELIATLRSTSHVEVVGLYTHFARAAQRDRAYTMKQYETFTGFAARLEKEGICPTWKHVCNSAAFLDYPEWHHDFVRVGTLLVGHYPGPGFDRKLNLRDPWTAKCRVVHLRKVPKGTAVGYQSIYHTKRETQLAVIPVGYADGFGIAPHFVPQGWIDFIKIILKNFLALFGIFLGQERVELKGRTVRVAGKIGMQLTVLDVGDLDCTLGDEVVIPLRRTLAGTRILRRYWQGGQILSARVIKEGILPINRECLPSG